MCPPVVPPADIGLYWSDEDLIMSLEKIECGSPLPGNVINYLNPYNYKPSDLPDGIWYFIHSEEKGDIEHGFWKAKGEACKIFTSSTITGWRTTLEFYEGQAPRGQKTDWVMQEYRITRMGVCEISKPKETGLLCRVFFSGECSSNQETHHRLRSADTAVGNHQHSVSAVFPNADNILGQGSVNESKVKNRDDARGSLPVAERFQNPPTEYLSENDYILGGDYLALDDLADPDSPSSRSDNSSCMTLSSGECFDSLALLRDLEDEVGHPQGNDANVNFSVSVSVRPNEVVMRPATLAQKPNDLAVSLQGVVISTASLSMAWQFIHSESLVSSNGNNPPTEGTLRPGNYVPSSVAKGKFQDKGAPKKGTKTQKANHMGEGTSNSCDVTASSNGSKEVSEREKKSRVGSLKRLKKNCLCFMPF